MKEIRGYLRGMENVPGLVHRGKVRDTYELSVDDFLLVATDRISSFDVVLSDYIPFKGLVLNLLSAFWFERTRHIIPNHMVRVVQDDVQSLGPFPENFNHRSMIIRKAEPIKVECIARGYLSGSAWQEYREYGTVAGKAMPKGLKESDKLPTVLFTPTTKAEEGHDEPITFEQMVDMLGPALANDIRYETLRVYTFATFYAESRGIIIADTKMEFGIIDDRLYLIDELLTPDSSRFWDKASYQPGGAQPSFDKQPVRDWLTASGWGKKSPAPQLPDEIIDATTERYLKAYELIVGQPLNV